MENENEEFEFRLRLEQESAPKEGAQTVENYKPKSSYEGIADDDLNFIQKAEKKGVDWGLVKPGHELFSPPAMEQKRLATKTAANTTTLGYLPQITAAAKTGSVSSPEYIQERDAQIEDLNKAESGTKAVGMALGTLPTMAAGIPKALVSTPGRAIGTAAATGFAANPGDTQGELSGPQLEGRIIGGAISGVLTAGLTAAPHVANWIGDKARKTAVFRSLKSAGAMLKDLRALDHRGRLEQTGQTLLDEGVVTPLATLEQIQKRSADAMQKHGEIIGKVEEALDGKFDLMAKSSFREKLVQPQRIASQIDELITRYADDPALADFAKGLQTFRDRFRAMGDGPIKFSKAQEIKRNFDQILNWDKEQTVGKELVKQVRGIVNGEIDGAIEAVGRQTGQPWYDGWKDAKQVYGAMKEVNEMAADRAFRNEANRFISPSDYGMGATGALITSVATGGAAIPAIATGAATAGVNKLARTYGSSIAATGANKVANAFQSPGAQQLSNYLSTKALPTGIAAAQAISGKLDSQDPEKMIQRFTGTKYENVLRMAKERGGDSFATTYFLLGQKDPEFQRLMNDQGKPPY